MMLNNNSIGINKVKESDISLEGNSNNLVNLDDSMKIYLKEIGKIPLLSRQEELDIAKDLNLAHMQHGGLNRE